jgi:hypothetical protein
VHINHLEFLQVACTLFYSDVNVTQPALGTRIRLCKDDAWKDIREFNKVAREVGTGTGKPILEPQEVRGLCNRTAQPPSTLNIESWVTNGIDYSAYPLVCADAWGFNGRCSSSIQVC